MTLEVLFPIALSCSFSYQWDHSPIPSDLKGRRVLVPFGKGNKLTIGVVIGYNELSDGDLKQVIALDASEYRLPSYFIDTIPSKASYYYAEWGDILKSSIPSDFWRVGGQIYDEKRLEDIQSYNFQYLRFELPKTDLPTQFYTLNTDTETLFSLSPKELEFVRKLEQTHWVFFNLSMLRQQQLSKSIMDRCIKKGALVHTPLNQTLPQNLNPEQQSCRDQIKHHFENNQKQVLLHGVTGSGKTHVFLDLINQQIQSHPGSTILYLLPEIAITSQLILRLQKSLGSIPLLAFHSQISNQQKNYILHQILIPRTHSIVIIGARSSALLPYSQLDLIVVDEEHEPNYKQTDKTPRYNIHEWIQWTAKHLNTNILLGSATPSIESYTTHQKNNTLVSLNSRHSRQDLPLITLLDKPTHQLFNSDMITRIQEQLDLGKQSIIYLNRRGYTPMVKCNLCHLIIKCPHCDISLTYHLDTNKLCCHHCSYSIYQPQQCSQCHSHQLNYEQGIGTQKIEQEITQLFPKSRCIRMDSDVVSSKKRLQEAVGKIQREEVDIIIGTQLISKGFDFENITLVAIVDIDSMLNFSDFRARERTFQQMVQVAGRAGRGKTAGRVYIQTNKPEDHTIQQILSQDYSSLFISETRERKQFEYPPYVRLCSVTLTSISEQDLHVAATYLELSLQRNYSYNFQGPCTPSVKKVQSYHRLEFWFKWSIDPKTYSHQHKQLKLILQSFKKHIKQPKLKVIVDVDPK